jgi:hypothetical protein
MQSPQHNASVLRKARASLVAMLLSPLALANASFAAVPNSEYLLLRAIYDSTNGSQWTNNSGWLQNNSAEVCTWYRVTCNAAGTNVTEVKLFDNNLAGTLPPSLTALPELTYFDATNNRLTGRIPQLSGLTLLTVFDVGGNRLSGPIPPLQNLPKLNVFSAYLNQLSGRIPDLSGAPLLRAFLVSRNDLTGSIPSLSALTRLETFNVRSNQLTGSLPELNGLAELKTLRVDDNQLSGALPTPPGSLTPSASRLCLNQFTDSQSDAWNIAVTGSAATSWNTNCVPLRNQLLLSFGAPPVLTPDSFGPLNVTVSPARGTQPLLFASLTPSVCSIRVAQLGDVSVSPNAPVGAVCTITADMAGDRNFNSAPQVQQDIVIAAAESPVSSVPALNPWAMLALASWLAAIGAMCFRRIGAR